MRPTCGKCDNGVKWKQDFENPLCECQSQPKSDGATKLAKLVLDWWEDHQYDTDDSGEYNTYSRDPDFVVKAKAIMAEVQNN